MFPVLRLGTLVWVRLAWDWQSRPWCREEWRWRGDWRGAVDTEPEMPLLQQNPFFKGSAVHSTYGGLGEGAEGDPPHGDRHSSQNYPRPPPLLALSKNQSASELIPASWDPKTALPLSGQVRPTLRDLCTPTTVSTR